MLCLLPLVAAVAGCSKADARPAAGSTTSAPVTQQTPTPTPAPSPSPCPVATHGFSCLMAEHIHEALRYAARRPGTIGFVVHDRANGATWRSPHAHTEFPAASTIKLAVITDLLLRNNSGNITLTPYDWNLIYNALHESSDSAATALWSSFENGSFIERIEGFGMKSAYFTSSPPYWGFMYCSPLDLDRLMNYVLNKLPDRDRDYIVSHLRHVAPIQQWGVWGAGHSDHPGNKDGWEYDGGIWITNTVGFAGPHEQYTLAIMYNLGGGTFHQGSNTLTQIASLIFHGHRAPQPTAQATE
jgi:hypothetical protein